MATLIPFQGLRYQQSLTSQLPQLVTPPYDIISAKEQERFYRAHPCNIIRLEYGKIRPQDTDSDNRYTRAQCTLQAWLTSGVLAQEAKPALYLLQTRFTDPQGKSRLFTGLFGCIQLEPLGQGSILPHERTFQGPKTDRLNLLRTTGVGLSPVFSLYQDPQKRITHQLKRAMQNRPQADFKDWSGSRHRLWVISQPAILRSLQTEFQTKKLLIADGHHRYSTALTYRDEVKAQGLPAADSVMMCLAESNDPGLTVLPVYRLVSGIPAAGWKRFRQALTEYFEIERVPAVTKLQDLQIRTEAKTGRMVLGCIGGLGPGAWMLKLKQADPAELMAQLMPGCSPLIRGLDLVVLHQLILNQLLGIPSGDEAGKIRYTKDAAEARRLVSRQEIQAAFLPAPPKLEQIWQIARQGEVMPQKSTYFLPKIITGLVMNPVDPRKMYGPF